MQKALREIRVNLRTLQTDWPVRLKLPTSGVAIEATLANISRQGMHLQTSVPIAAGTTVEFELLRDNRPLFGQGEVRWMRDASSNEAGVGIQIHEFFENGEAGWLEVLESALNQLRAGDFALVPKGFLKKDQRLVDAAPLISQAPGPMMVVVDQQSRPVGLFTLKSLFTSQQQLQSMDSCLGDLPLEPVLTLEAKSSVAELLQQMRLNPGKGVVLTRDGRAQGIINISQVMNYCFELARVSALVAQKAMLDATNVIAHDLASPVGIIRTTNSLLSCGIVTPESYLDEGMATMVDDHCQKLLDLIDDMLSLGRRDPRSVSLARENFDIDQLLRNVCNQFQAIAKSKNIQLRYVPVNATPLLLHGDVGKLERVFANLVSNGLKYSPQGAQVFVEASKKDQGVLIRVVDTGQGIASHELPRVFDEFARISSVPTQGERSHGLGLAISKTFVEAHGGTISVVSELGKGTTFTVFLPPASTP